MNVRALTLLPFSLTVGCMVENSLSAVGRGHLESDSGYEIDVDTETEQETDEDLTEENDYEEPVEEEGTDTLPTEEEKDEIEFETEPAPENDCTETSDLIYTVDRDSQEMFIFDPVNATFSSLGTLPCDDWGWEGDPGSMGVSRNGYAYVRYSGGTLYEIDLTDLSCNEGNFSSHNFGAYGMGYATNHQNTWQDQLYIANSNNIASLDVNSGQYSVIGQMPSQSELTGNANGELWAFLPLEQPAKLVQVNKNNGDIIESLSITSFSLQDLDTFAFAYWGGDFYLFVRTLGMGQSTNVYRVERDGTQTLILEDSGLNIVGAGVSTCAPTE